MILVQDVPDRPALRFGPERIGARRDLRSDPLANPLPFFLRNEPPGCSFLRTTAEDPPLNSGRGVLQLLPTHGDQGRRWRAPGEAYDWRDGWSAGGRAAREFQAPGRGRHPLTRHYNGGRGREDALASGAGADHRTPPPPRTIGTCPITCPRLLDIDTLPKAAPGERTLRSPHGNGGTVVLRMIAGILRLGEVPASVRRGVGLTLRPARQFVGPCCPRGRESPGAPYLCVSGF
jgi:hypothetical protein